MPQFEKLLSGGDLRSTGKSNSVVLKIKSQKDFDALFKCLFQDDRIVVMRTADAIEKSTISSPGYLKKHKAEVLKLCTAVRNKELKWHLALLVPRLQLSKSELGIAWNTLTDWAKDRANSRIVRVNSIQALFELLKHNKSLEQDYLLTLLELDEENIPSIKARIRILRAFERKQGLPKKQKD